VENIENYRSWRLIKKGKATEAFEEVHERVKPLEEGMLRIRVHAFGLNYADVLSRKGLYNDAPPFPFVPGYEASGKVIGVGAGVEDSWLGKRVLAFSKFGAYTELLDSSPTITVEIPDHYTFAESTALATQYTTAWCLCREWTKVQPKDKVVILSAAGGVGQALISFLKPLGTELYLGSRSQQKAEKLAQEHGAYPLVYSLKKPWFKSMPKDIKADVVFDPIGGASVGKGIKYLAPGGRMLSYGVAMRSTNQRFWRDISMVWGFGLHHPIALLLRSKSLLTFNLLRIAEQRPELLGTWMQKIVAEVSDPKFPKPKVHTFAWKQLPEAHDFLASGKSTGKLAIDCIPD
jgi:NADPH:quinone reductase-like Zn-dependent oxidoreductase